MVEDPASILKPVIKMADELRPEQQVNIKVAEAGKKPMTYTLAVVEDGLLDLTRFRTPNPWNHFYAREALGVKTWDMFDLVMGARNASMERLLAIGGDEALRKMPNEKANRFKPVVRYFGPFELKAGAENTHSFTMPRYVGSVRVMVVAGQNAAYGNAEKTVPVRQPLMVLASMPRVLGPGEEIKLPVTVFAMDPSVKKVNVEVQVSNNLSVNGSKTNSLSFDAMGDDITEFTLKAGELTGIGKVTVIARSGNHTAREDIEFDIRNPNPLTTDFIDTMIAAGASLKLNYAMTGIPGTNSVSLEISTIPSINLTDRMRQLIRYPHGCLEQVTSGAFPQLYVMQLMEVPQSVKDAIDLNMKAAIDRIRNYQTSAGGFSYWPANSAGDDWATSYAGHYLLEAANQGYMLPPGLLDRWKNYQQQRANSWTYNATHQQSDLIQAYRLYTLALAKAPAMGAMNRMKEIPNLSVTAKWRLAAAYAMAGRPEVAKQIIQNLGTEVKPYREMAYTYGSHTRDEAMILETLTLLGEKTNAQYFVRSLAGKLGNANDWMSTQEMAYSMMALSKHMANEKFSPMNLQANINGSQVTIRSDKPVFQYDVPLRAERPGTIDFRNTGGSVVYVRLIQQGIPMPGNERAAENNLKVDVTYKSLDGKTIDPTVLAQATNFIAEVRVSNPGMRGDYSQLALTQIFPGGWEIINTRLLEMNSTQSTFDHMDIRDDRVYTYFGLRRNETKVFKVLLNSSYSGSFYLPAVNCEAMYDNTINARTAGRWVLVGSGIGGAN